MISVKIANKDSEELLPYFTSPVIKGWDCRPGPHFCRLAMLPLRVSILNGYGYNVPFVQFYLIIKRYCCCVISDKSNSKHQNSFLWDLQNFLINEMQHTNI